MTIEEKAKAYDEAKARMSKAYNDNRCSLYFMNEIFPETKVSKDADVKLTIIQFLEYASSHGCPDILSKEKAKTWIAWLEKQGEQILANSAKTCKNEQNSAWSEEDEKALCDALWAMKIAAKIAKDENDMGNIWYAENWLKSLKERMKPQNIAYYNPYKEVVESIAEMCKHYDKASHSGLRDFYDNVKVKCKDAKEYNSLYPQNTWKPSEEQIQALEYQVHSTYKGSWQYMASKELLEQLKKL